MNVDKIPPERALEAGAELWVIPALQNTWWQTLNFRSGFLLSTCLLHQNTEPSAKIEEILKETQLDKKVFKTLSKCLLIGTENHFLNKWLLITPEASTSIIPEVFSICDSLKVGSVRFFSSPPELVDAFSTRLSASLNRISFVE